jgi:DNA repair protein RadB
METKISAGSYDLNKWLFGGYEKDIITTLYGPAGSGKTNFCILVTASQAKKGNKVIYIDTEGGFSVDRFKQILSDDWKTALENIMLMKPTTFQEQWDAFGKLLKELKANKSISLIIVDGMTMLYRLELAECHDDIKKVHEINSRLARQMRMLAEIARKHSIPVIITNQVYSSFISDHDMQAGKAKEVNMVGGDILRYWSKCLIELQSERGKRKAILKKHRSLEEKELNFYINNSGIHKSGWFG